jgi:hypothetical protein
VGLSNSEIFEVQSVRRRPQSQRCVATAMASTIATPSTVRAVIDRRPAAYANTTSGAHMAEATAESHVRSSPNTHGGFLHRTKRLQDKTAPSQTAIAAVKQSIARMLNRMPAILPAQRRKNPAEMGGAGSMVVCKLRWHILDSRGMILP